ncbi:MAG: hypothetical protein AAF889_05810 [Cyanobacteria bacterium P01_D01_bin.73]
MVESPAPVDLLNCCAGLKRFLAANFSQLADCSLRHLLTIFAGLDNQLLLNKFPDVPSF